MQYRAAEREINELRDKLVNTNRNLSTANSNISNLEVINCQLRGKIILN